MLSGLSLDLTCIVGVLGNDRGTLMRATSACNAPVIMFFVSWCIDDGLAHTATVQKPPNLSCPESLDSPDPIRA